MNDVQNFVHEFLWTNAWTTFNFFAKNENENGVQKFVERLNERPFSFLDAYITKKSKNKKFKSHSCFT